jgi:hypothetical protein
MNFHKPLIIVFILILSLSFNALAQQTELTNQDTSLKKNIIFLTLGYAPMWSAANTNYERMVYENRDWFFNSFYAKIGGGYFATWGYSGPNFNGGLTFLGGKNNSHLEIDGGVAVIIDDWDGDVDVYPGGAVGYRFQKPGGRFVFRTGVGYPESFYLSCGFAF